MRISAPVTDYIRASRMNTKGDLVVRGDLVPERLPAGADGHYFQGSGAGEIPGYTQQMPPLTTRGDLLTRGTLIPERIASDIYGKVLMSKGVGTKSDWTSLFNVLTTEGDIWVRGATFVQRVAAGALDTYFKGQGAGNLPIYEKLALRDTGVYINVLTRTTGGNQVITGVGYKSSTVIFIGMDAPLYNMNISWGFDNSNKALSIAIFNNGTDVSYRANDSIFIEQSAGNYLLGHIASMDIDGYTFAWTLSGACSVTAIYLCFP